jgi:peptidoglycan/LPS O-acetylase OafA/YrhL
VAPLPRFPALDGLRGLAVAAVVLYHAEVLRGGWLGVDLFFVLSGFLITRLLAVERARSGRIDLAGFWRRRARRLLPALVLAFVVVAAFSAWYPDPVLLPDDLHWQLAAAAGYVANWYQLAAGNGYWDTYAVEPLRHMWSLSIEEQHYLVAPLLLVGALAVVRRRALVGWGFLGLAVASWTLGVVRLAGGEAFDRVYMGTPTRVGAVFLGAAAGWFSVSPAHRARLVRWARPAAAPALALVLVGLVVVDGATAWPPQRWLLLPAFELAVCVLLVAALEEPSSLPVVLRAAAVRPLLWLGAVSYGLYLFHVPVLLATERVLVGSSRWVVVTVAVAASLAAAAASYHLVERPVRSGAVARSAPRGALSVVGVVLSVASFLVVLDATEPAREHRRLVGPDAGGGDLVVAGDVTVPPAAAAPGPEAAGAPGPDGPASLPLARPADRATRMLLVGDSMALTIAPELERRAAERGVALSHSTPVGCVIGGPDVRSSVAEGPYSASHAETCERWEDSFPDLVARTRPDVVLVLRAEVRRTLPGSETRADRCGDAFGGWYRSMLADRVDVLGGDGATVAVSTLVYNRFAGRSVPERERELDCVNRLTRELLPSTDRGVAVPLNEWLCPDGPVVPCLAEVDGTNLRPDGLHFTGGGDAVAAEWLLDTLFGPVASR